MRNPFWKDPIPTVFLALSTGLLVVAIMIPKPKRPESVITTKLSIDCNRPEGHKSWEVDSIVFLKSTKMTLHNGDIKEEIDFSGSLYSIHLSS